MAMTSDQRADAIFKKLQGKANTSPYLEFYEEPLSSSIIVTPENFWGDVEFIPETAPSLQDREEFIITFDNGYELPVLRRYKDLFLDPVPGSASSFYHEHLIDAIPHDYSDGSYHYTLHDSTGQEIAYGLNAWFVDTAAGALTFYQGVPEDVVPPLTISFYKYIGRKIFERFVTTDGVTPMIDEYEPSLDQHVTTKRYVDRVVVSVRNAVDKLLPEGPPTLDTRQLVMQLYKAYEVGTGAEFNCTKEEFPEVHVNTPFSDGPVSPYKDRETLTAFINGDIVGEADLVPESNVGVYDGLHITADKDPYAGENQRQGIHKELSVFFTPLKALEPGQEHSAQLIHSKSGGPPPKLFWKDVPSQDHVARVPHGTTFFENPDISALNIAYVSGVPTLTPQSSIPLSILVARIANLYYPDIAAKLTSSHLQSIDFETYKVIDDPSEVLTYNVDLQVRPNVYTEEFEFQFAALNSAREPSSPRSYSRPARIDTVSDETLRVASGPGMYPDNNEFGGPYPSSEDLGLNEELQMINGSYRWPSGDYSQNIPPGPNYDDINHIPNTGIRWVTFSSIDLRYADGFTLFVNEAKEWVSSPETKVTGGVHILAKVRNVQDASENTGWIDCNSPYQGVGKPVNDGDTAMIVPGSSATVKRVSFGPTARSGRLYIRIGFSVGIKQLSTITVTPN